MLDDQDSNFGIIRERVIEGNIVTINEIMFFPEDEGLSNLRHGDVVWFHLDETFTKNSVAKNVEFDHQQNYKKAAGQ
jgi:hypothetical protein